MLRRHALALATSLPFAWRRSLATTPSGATAGAAGATWRFDVLDIGPFGLRGPAGEVQGALADIAEALGRLAGHAVQTRLVPLGRALQDLNAGVTDLSILLPLQGLSPQVSSIAKLTELDVQVLPRPGLVLDAKTPLNGLRVASFGGNAVWGIVSQAAGVKHQRVSSVKALLGMLRAQRVDAVVGVK